MVSQTLRLYRRPFSTKEARKGWTLTLLLCKMLLEPGRVDGVAVFYKLPMLDLGKAGADVTGKWLVNRNTGHLVGWVPKLLKIWLSLTFPLRSCQVAFLYVDADDVYRIIVLSIPEATLALFYTGLLDVIWESGWGQFPNVS